MYIGTIHIGGSPSFGPAFRGPNYDDRQARYERKYFIYKRKSL